MSATAELVCPGCTKKLRVPERLRGKTIRCKSCGQAVPFTASATIEKIVQAESKTSPPPVTRAATRLRSPTTRAWLRYLMPMVMLLVLLGSLGGLLWYFRAELAAALDQGAPQAAAPEAAPLLVVANPTATADQPAARPTRPAQTAPRGRNRYRGRIPQPFPGRALLIGAKNYLYLNPINPGYREEGRSRDLLGLAELAKLLVEEHGFLYEQVAELSDVASRNNPFPPTKAILEDNIARFLAEARPEDHVILLFVGHAVEVNDELHLVPLDGEPSRVESLLPAKQLLDLLVQSPAHHKLLILDLSPVDPEQGKLRPIPEPVTEKALQILTAPPPGVQVWLSSSPGQPAWQFTSGGFVGSVFLHYLVKTANLRPVENWNRIADRPGVREGKAFALPLLAPAIAEAVEKSAGEKGQKQQPKLYGTVAEAPTTASNDPPKPVQLTQPAGTDVKLVTDILRELPLSADPLRQVRPEALPTFDQALLAKYAADQRVNFKTLEELRDRFKENAFRHLTVQAAVHLEKTDFRLRMQYRYNANDAQFKRQLESEQMRPASLAADLQDLYEQLAAATEKRDEETSPRWRAHHDYVTARVLAKLITLQEYNFVLGNNLRKDSPTLEDPRRNNGWAIVPQEKLQQTETRAFEKERKKYLERILAEHAGTPWEMLARRELLMPLGLTLQEARVEP